jgi:hypothetical protein
MVAAWSEGILPVRTMKVVLDDLAATVACPPEIVANGLLLDIVMTVFALTAAESPTVQ